ncbi:MAG: 2OG-Fe(II) oxygenase [Rhizobacter sp.]|nr:2OG-Fe(II) oxygenase [Rhizobacter sp.]
MFDEAYLLSLRERLVSAVPYPHLVVDGWFNPDLLRLVHEEFDLYPGARLQAVRTKREATYRSQTVQFGPATTLYFSVVNGGWFVNVLSRVTDIAGLLPDPSLHGGGLHESRKGGRFQVHRDFDHHPRTGLSNEMVLLTYLNRDWNPAWQGALELWETDPHNCAKLIQPEFGRTVILPNGPRSFHGHELPLDPPPGRTRRSLATYYYSNRVPLVEQVMRPTVFLTQGPVDRMKVLLRSVTPPVIWWAVKSVLERGAARRASPEGAPGRRVYTMAHASHDTNDGLDLDGRRRTGGLSGGGVEGGREDPP